MHSSSRRQRGGGGGTGSRQRILISGKTRCCWAKGTDHWIGLMHQDLSSQTTKSFGLQTLEEAGAPVEVVVPEPNLTQPQTPKP
jgi:hypothetical protein